MIGRWRREAVRIDVGASGWFAVSSPTIMVIVSNAVLVAGKAVGVSGRSISAHLDLDVEILITTIVVA